MTAFRSLIAILAIAFAPYVHAEQGTGEMKNYNVGGGLDLVGTVGYTINQGAGTLRIEFDELENDATVTSGNIIVAIIATTAPIVEGQNFNFYVLGGLTGTPLQPNFHYVDIDQTVTLQVPPPNGVYYISIVVLEQELGCTSTGVFAGYCMDDFHTFAGTRAVVGGVWQAVGSGSSTTPAVEYFHTVFAHFFVTADPDEIAGLDAGAFGGVFVRTGETWNVWTAASSSGVGVCRFFTTPGTFGTRSSHFYTPDPTECNGLKLNPNWIYEKIAGRVALPSGGVCPAGTQALYRLYNNGITGAPNHRYTKSLTIRNQMISQFGFTPEDANTACVPL
jgi:hypothetical protein